MAYINSSNISVFPSIYRSYAVEGKYTSEANLTNILKCLTSQDSFVCDDHSLVVGGYYFELTGTTIPDLKGSPATNNTFASIFIETSSGRLVSDTGSTDLDSSGSGAKFKGLVFGTSASTAPSGCTVVSLQVRNTSGELVNTKRFDFNTVEGTRVSGGSTETVAMSDMFNSDLTLKPEFGGTGSSGLSGVTVGTAAKATKLSDESQIGSSTAPVYFNGGVPIACGNSLVVDVFAGRLEGTADKALKLVKHTGQSEEEVSAGSSTQPVYFNNGVPVACSSTLGVGISGNAATATAIAGGQKGSYTQCVYMNANGVPTAGFKVTYSTSAPTTGAAGTAGDLWIVYE